MGTIISDDCLPVVLVDREAVDVAVCAQIVDPWGWHRPLRDHATKADLRAYHRRNRRRHREWLRALAQLDRELDRD